MARLLVVTVAPAALRSGLRPLRLRALRLPLRRLPRLTLRLRLSLRLPGLRVLCLSVLALPRRRILLSRLWATVRLLPRLLRMRSWILLLRRLRATVRLLPRLLRMRSGALLLRRLWATVRLAGLRPRLTLRVRRLRGLSLRRWRLPAAALIAISAPAIVVVGPRRRSR